MARGGRIEWLTPTMTLCVLWLIVTVGFVLLIAFLDVGLPRFLAKAGPFIIAGFITGRLVGVSERRPKIIAAAVLALVSAVAWSSFSFATNEMAVDRALLLLVLSLPVSLVGAAWAYFGMFLGGRRKDTASAGRTGMDPELEDLERELKNEIARERGLDPSP